MTSQANVKVNHVTENTEANILMPENSPVSKSNNLIDLSNQPLQSHVYKEIINFVYHISEIYLNEYQIEQILEKNPQLRLEILKHNSIENIYVSDGILSAIAFYFLGSDWPNIKDYTSQSNFVYHLNKKAEKMGYRVAKII